MSSKELLKDQNELEVEQAADLNARVEQVQELNDLICKLPSTESVEMANNALDILFEKLIKLMSQPAFSEKAVTAKLAYLQQVVGMAGLCADRLAVTIGYMTDNVRSPEGIVDKTAGSVAKTAQVEEDDDSLEGGEDG